VTPHTIAIDGNFADWKSVEPEFRDHLADAVHRNHLACDGKTPYVNQTGRNDIVATKVAYDAANVYFYVRTQGPLSPSSDPNWMLLFLDADHDPATGWLGYDFVVNRKSPKPHTATIERNLGGYRWGSPIEIDYRVAGNEMELAIPRNVLNQAKLPAAIDFKWADNIQQTGDASDFMLNGDVAPPERFNYRARLEVER
jgi:hypothetical protein